MNKYICKVWATIYDPGLGDPEDGIPPGTPFEELPKEWVCPVCGATQDKFKILPPEKYKKIFSEH